MLNRILFIYLIFFLFPGLYNPGLLIAETLPLRVRLVLSKAAPLQEKEEYQKAVEILAEFQARGSQDNKEIYNHPAINFALGNCLMLQKKHGQAVTAYHRVITRDPKHLGGWQNLASSQYQTGAHAAASHSYHKVYQLTVPRKPEFLYYAATAAIQAGQANQAVKLFETLFNTHPKAVKLNWREYLVHTLLDLGEVKKALRHIEILVQKSIGRKQQQWQELILYKYLELDMAEKALNLANKLSHETPDNPLWWKGLTHIHLLSKQHDKALENLIIYSLLSPLTEEEQKLLADLYLQEGVPVKAATLYEKLLENKQSSSIIQRLARAYIQQDRADLALASLTRFSKGVEKDEQTITMLRGDLLYQLQKFKEAAALFEKAARQKQDNTGRAWLMAGYCHWQLKNYKAGINAFKKAEADKKQKKEATHALHLLLKQEKAEKGNI
jgi:tetratricopeptide (TPR) repeat protein